MDDKMIVVIEAISQELQILMQSVIDRSGVDSQAANSLNDSLSTDFSVEGSSIVIRLLYTNYLHFIDQGRAPRLGKQPPTEALRDWALERGIPTDNSTLYLISRAIWRDGIEARPIFSILREEVDNKFQSDWGERIVQVVADHLAESLSQL